MIADRAFYATQGRIAGVNVLASELHIIQSFTYFKRRGAMTENEQVAAATVAGWAMPPVPVQQTTIPTAAMPLSTVAG